MALYPLFCGILMNMFFLKGLHDGEDKIRDLSRKDGLTNIWNRCYLREIFARELQSALRATDSLGVATVSDHRKLNADAVIERADQAPMNLVRV